MMQLVKYGTNFHRKWKAHCYKHVLMVVYHLQKDFQRHDASV